MSVKALCKGNRAETEQSTRTGGDGKRSAIARLCFFGKRGRTMAAHNRISCKPPGKGQNMRAFSLQKNKLDAPFLSPRQITRKNYHNLQNTTKHLQKEGILRGHRNRITDTYKRKSRKRNGVAAYWLELLFETGYIAESTYKPLQNQCGAIRRMLISSLNTAKEGCR